MTKYVISGFADEMYDSFVDQLKGHSALGLDRIELRFLDGKNISTLTGAEVAETFRLLHVHKIRPAAIGSPIGKISLDDDLDQHFELARRVFHIAQVLGAKGIRVFSFYPHKDKPFDDADREVIVNFLGRLVDLAKYYRVVVCLENERNVYGESPERARELLERFDGNLRCVFDMGNFVHDGYDPEAAYEVLSDYVHYFHIKEVNKSGEMVMTGDGDAKIAEILAKHYARTDAKETVISLEPHLADFGGLSSLTDACIKQNSGVSDRVLAYMTAAERLKEIVKNIEA